MLDLYISIQSYRSFGGTPEFQAIESYFGPSGQDFGSALETIELTLRFASKPGIAPRRTLEAVFESYHDNLKNNPERTFRRKKALLALNVYADFVFAEDIIPRNSKEYEARNERYNYDWQVAVSNILITELEASKSKFKSTDDLDVLRLMDWVKGLPTYIPRTKAEAEALAEKLNKHRSEIRSRMSPWEHLDIDWDDYHPNARKLVPDHRLWSSVNDLAPNGNDTGADILALVQDQKKALMKSIAHGKNLYKDTWSNWGFAWPPERQPSDSSDYHAHRELILGLAFAYLKILGNCPAWLRDEAIVEITSYKDYVERQLQDWPHAKEALTIQTEMDRVLRSAAST